MRVGIVGSEAAKFTPETELEARDAITAVITYNQASLVVSGACPLGGIDIWAIEVARQLGVPVKEFPPKAHSWQWYKQRNVRIACASDIIVCITVRTLPPTYDGMTFGECYHCHTTEHVKSGGCWTVKRARKLGKDGYVLVVG